MSDPRADALRKGYATVAHAYAEHLLGELAGKPLDRAFLRAFVERAKGPIVDLGCGPGHVAAFLAELGATVEGVDLSEAMIAEARARFAALPFTVADMFALPHADGALGGIVAFYSIVHLAPADVERALCEMVRVLAPGGLLALAFHIGTESVHVDELFGCATSLDFQFHPPDAIVRDLAAAGFVLEARLDRAPYSGAEHPSQRCYLLARKS